MTKQAMSEGAWAANFGATKQALASVVVKSVRYFGLSRKEMSPRLATSSGFTSPIAVSGLAPLARLAPATSLKVRKGNGPARSKKPGCSIKSTNDVRQRHDAKREL